MFNETSYLGALSGYVRSGDALYYAATISNISGDPLGIIPGGATPATRNMLNAIIRDVRSNGFTILNQEIVPSAGSIAFNVRAPGDFSDSNDVKALFDGIVQSNGGRLRASNIQHRALNLAGPETLNPSLNKSVLEVAGDWWSSVASEAASAIGTPLGFSNQTVMIGIAVIGGLLLFSVMKR